MSINIRRDNDDPFYRYKMPPIQTKVEGRGNGIKTAVVNAAQVARALSRPPSYVIKYFGFELGAQTTISDEDERYIINGVHESSKLQDTLDGFISKFVLCDSCKNPETEYMIKKGDIHKDCKACGVRSGLDARHKLFTYIIKNPPSSQKTKRKGMANAAANTSNNVDEETAGDANGDAAAAAAPEEKQEEEEGYDDDALTQQINADVAAIKVTDDAEVEWSVDVSEEAVRARQREMEDGMAAVDIAEEKQDISVFETLGDYITNKSPSDVEIYRKAKDLGIEDDHKTVGVLAQCLLEEDVLKGIDAHTGLFAKLIQSGKHEQAMLGGVERLVGLEKPDMIKYMPKILEKLYDNDLVSEEEAISWGTKVSKKYVDKETSKKVRKAAKPFIDWLQTADSSDEESD